MSECEARNCGYYYQDECDKYPHCHYEDTRFPAPCEYDDEDYDYY